MTLADVWLPTVLIFLAFSSFSSCLQHLTCKTKCALEPQLQAGSTLVVPSSNYDTSTQRSSLCLIWVSLAVFSTSGEVSGIRHATFWTQGWYFWSLLLSEMEEMTLSMDFPNEACWCQSSLSGHEHTTATHSKLWSAFQPAIHRQMCHFLPRKKRNVCMLKEHCSAGLPAESQPAQHRALEPCHSSLPYLIALYPSFVLILSRRSPRNFNVCGRKAPGEDCDWSSGRLWVDKLKIKSEFSILCLISH